MLARIRSMPRYDLVLIALGLLVGFLAVPTINKTFTPSSLPPGTSTSRMISAAHGGSVELADGTRVDFPVGALASDAQVSVSVLSPAVFKIPADTSASVREINVGNVSLNSRAKLSRRTKVI